jgi:histidine ammonia-lyase
MQEDHVSMGWSGARKLRRSVDNLRRILTVELVASARGIDLRAPLLPGPATGAVVRALRETVPGPGADRYLAPELAAAYEFVLAGAVERTISDAGITLP